MGIVDAVLAPCSAFLFKETYEPAFQQLKRSV